LTDRQWVPYVEICAGKSLFSFNVENVQRYEFKLKNNQGMSLGYKDTGLSSHHRCEKIPSSGYILKAAARVSNLQQQYKRFVGNLLFYVLCAVKMICFTLTE